MLYLIMTAGAIQLTRWALALLDAIEKPSVPTPTKARHRGAWTPTATGQPVQPLYQPPTDKTRRKL